MISRQEVKTFASMSPTFDDMTCSLAAAPKLPKGMVKETKKIIRPA
ncbi:MAG: hypothetical protein ACKVE4_04705 [Dissulfuribacterales bacterium]